MSYVIIVIAMQVYSSALMKAKRNDITTRKEMNIFLHFSV